MILLFCLIINKLWPLLRVMYSKCQSAFSAHHGWGRTALWAAGLWHTTNPSSADWTEPLWTGRCGRPWRGPPRTRSPGCTRPPPCTNREEPVSTQTAVVCCVFVNILIKVGLMSLWTMETQRVHWWRKKIYPDFPIIKSSKIHEVELSPSSFSWNLFMVLHLQNLTAFCSSVSDFFCASDGKREIHTRVQPHMLKRFKLKEEDFLVELTHCDRTAQSGAGSTGTLSLSDAPLGEEGGWKRTSPKPWKPLIRPLLIDHLQHAGSGIKEWKEKKLGLDCFGSTWIEVQKTNK